MSLFEFINSRIKMGRMLPVAIARANRAVRMIDRDDGLILCHPACDETLNAQRTGRLKAESVHFRDACAMVNMYHRHHASPIGHLFSGAVYDGNVLPIAYRPSGGGQSMRHARFRWQPASRPIAQSMNCWGGVGMRNKSWKLSLGDTVVLVEAEAEGQARYMVRLSIPDRMGRVRIGYLTGQSRQWLAEFFGKKPSVPATSAKAACRVIAGWAIEQPNIKPYLA